PLTVALDHARLFGELSEFRADLSRSGAGPGLLSAASEYEVDDTPGGRADDRPGDGPGCRDDRDSFRVDEIGRCEHIGKVAGKPPTRHEMSWKWRGQRPAPALVCSQPKSGAARCERRPRGPGSRDSRGAATISAAIAVSSSSVSASRAERSDMGYYTE